MTFRSSDTFLSNQQTIQNFNWHNDDDSNEDQNNGSNGNDNDHDGNMSMDANHGDATNDENGNNNNNGNGNDDNIRTGTLSSACFNILSTMVGGGSLSLPLAFHQAGNGFTAPFLLLVTAYLVKASIHFLIDAAKLSTKLSSSSSISLMSSSLSLKQKNKNQKGTVSYESLSCAAFGPGAKYFTMGLISTICFFTIVGYGVLLRDMLLPLSDTIFPTNNANNNETANAGPTLAHNATLLIVMLLVTPLCTLRNLTALEPVGAASMASLGILAFCISYRSIECNFSSAYDDVRLMPWYDYIHFTPTSITDDNDSDNDVSQWDNILNALPILISVFMCHFNVLPVHNELHNPSKPRVKTLFTITIWGATGFYATVGFIGSMYGNCTTKGAVEGNVLLSFDESDVLLMVGRACLSLTITFAFPILVVPARDIFLRGVEEFRGWYEKKRSMREGGEEDGNGGADWKRKSEYRLSDIDGGDDDEYDNRNRNGLDGDLIRNDLAEPLLFEDYNVEGDANIQDESNDFDPASNEYFEDNDNSNDNELMSSRNRRGNKKGQTISKYDVEKKEKNDNVWRIASSIAIFWSGAAVACCVKDIDVVWDFLGGSLSLIMGFLIPSGAILVLYAMVARKLKYRNADDDDDDINMNEFQDQQGGETTVMDEPIMSMSKFDKIMAWALIIIFVPMMFILTGNAVYNLGSDG